MSVGNCKKFCADLNELLVLLTTNFLFHSSQKSTFKKFNQLKSLNVA